MLSKVTKGQGITLASLVAAVPVVFGGQTYLDNKYAPAAEYVMAGEFKAMNLRVLKGQFWDRMDDLQEARGNNNVTREQDIIEELTDLLSDICELQPTFRYCETGIPE